MWASAHDRCWGRIPYSLFRQRAAFDLPAGRCSVRGAGGVGILDPARACGPRPRGTLVRPRGCCRPEGENGGRSAPSSGRLPHGSSGGPRGSARSSDPHLTPRAAAKPTPTGDRSTVARREWSGVTRDRPRWIRQRRRQRLLAQVVAGHKARRESGGGSPPEDRPVLRRSLDEGRSGTRSSSPATTGEQPPGRRESAVGGAREKVRLDGSRHHTPHPPSCPRVAAPVISRRRCGARTQ